MPAPTSELSTRISGLHLLAGRLKKLSTESTFRPPTGEALRATNTQLESLCDEVERLIWKLSREIPKC